MKKIFYESEVKLYQKQIKNLELEIKNLELENKILDTKIYKLEERVFKSSYAERIAIYEKIDFLQNTYHKNCSKIFDLKDELMDLKNSINSYYNSCGDVRTTTMKIIIEAYEEYSKTIEY